MRQSFDRGLVVAAGLMAILLTVDAWINFHNIARLSEDEGLITRTYQVRVSADLVLQSIINAETGYRGFLLTSNESFLAPYQNARENLVEHVNQLAALTEDDASQSSRVSELEAQVDQLLELYRFGIDEQRQGQTAPEANMALQESKRSTDALREKLSEIQSAESRLLAMQELRANKAYRFSWVSGLVTLAVSLIMFLLVIWLMRLNLSSHEKASARVFEERERLRVTLESIGDGVITTDTDGRVTSLNGLAEELTGWKSAEAIGLHLTEIFHIIDEATREPVVNPVHRTLEEGVIVGLANHTVLVSRDGSERAIADSSAPIWNREEEIVGTVLVFRDASEERAKELAKEELAKLTALRADVSTSLASHAEQSEVLNDCCQAIVKHLNAAFVRIWTLDASQEVLELQASAGIYSHLDGPHGQIPVGEFKIGKIAAAKKPLLSNDVQQDPNVGDQAWARREGMVAFAGYPLMIEGRVVGVMALFARHALSDAVLADLAPVSDLIAQWIDRRAVERAIHAADEQFRTLANTIPHLAWMAHPNGDINWYNQRWYDYTGKTLEEMSGWGWQSVHHPDEVDRVVTKIRKAFESGDSWEDTFPLRRHDGEYRWHLSRMQAIRNSEGEVVRWFGTNTDITEQREAERQLRESEENLRRVIDSMFSFVGILTPEGRLIEANQAPLDVADLKREDVLNKFLWETYWWSDDPQSEQRLSSALQRALQGEVVRYEETVRVKGGDHIIVDFMLQPVYEEGKLKFIIPSGVDITDRKRMEEELATSREFLRSSFDALTSQVAVLSDSGKILAVNAAWRRYLNENGLDESRHGVGGNYLSESLHSENGKPENFAEVRDCIQSVINGTQTSCDLEYSIDSDREQHWFQMRVSRFQGPGPAQVVISRQEITERILLEQSRQKRTDQLATLASIATQLNAAHDVNSILGIVTAGSRLIIGSHQATARRMVDPGWEQAVSALSLSEKYADWRGHQPDPNGNSLEKFLCEQNLPLRLTQSELEAHPAWNPDDAEAEHDLPTRGWLAAPLTTFDGRNLGLVRLSDKHEGEFTHDDELMLVQLAQMASVALENTRLYEDLRTADKRKDQFLATLAHELRNPLSPLTAAAQLLSDEPENIEQVNELADVISRQCEQLKRLIEDLLDVSRISTGKVHLRYETVDLRRAISAALDISRPIIESAGHALSLDLPESPVIVNGDRVRLSQIVANLLINAAKYTNENGKVSLSLQSTDGFAELRVEDNGIGIPAEMLTSIFELFAQVDSSHTRSQGGLGIGLTLVKTLVTMHGGQITASSDGPDRGSSFLVKIPLSQADEAVPVRSEQKNLQKLPCFRILLVDDNHAASYLLSRLLDRLGQETYVADSGKKALDQLPKFRPDIVISDIAMPEMTGYELAEHIRTLHPEGKPLLVALTGYGQASDRQEALQAGFDEHLVKPIGLPALKMLLHSLVQIMK